MADTKISALTVATTPLAGTEVLPIVQGGVTKQVSIANLTAGRAVSADSLTLTGSPLSVTSGGTGLATLAQGDLLYGSATNTLSALAKNTTPTRYLSNSGSSNNPAWAQVDLTNGVTGTLPVGNFPSNTITQVINSTLVTFKNTTSTSFVDTTLSASITPRTNTNKVLVIVTLNGLNGTGGATASYILTDNAGNQLSVIANRSGVFDASLTYLHSPATTSSYTYRVYYKQNGGTAAYLNDYTLTNNGTISSITLMEVVA